MIQQLTHNKDWYTGLYKH